MLTAQQQIAFDKIRQFLQNPTDNIFILKGYAGTGKTFLIREIAEYLRETKRNYFISAPTGRAAQNLNEKITEDATTIHKLIYSKSDVKLSETEDEDEHQWLFEINVNRHSCNAVYIFDESSMISDSNNNDNYLQFGSGKLLTDILTFIGYCPQTIDKKDKCARKIIFVGDHAQLPPIGNTSSDALSAKYLEENFNVIAKEFALTDIVRQSKEDQIIGASLKIRNSISNKTFNEFNISDVSQEITEVENFYPDKDKINETIVITYSNSTALSSNLSIRKKVFHHDKKELLKNEKLVVIANNYFYGLMNGDFIYSVYDYNEVEQYVQNLSGREKPITITFRKIRIKRKNIGGIETSEDILIIDNLLWSEHRDLTVDEMIALRIIARKKLKAKYPPKKLKKSNPREYKLLKEDYIKALKESPYFNAVRLKFGYAVTCHKAQGGEWENVFIDFTGFSTHTNEMFFRWAYTAITRSKEKIFTINPPRFDSASKITYDTNNEIKENIPLPFTSPDEIDYPFELPKGIPKNIYSNIYLRLKDKSFAIENVTQMKWKERYLISNKSTTITLDVNYNSKGKVKIRTINKGNDEIEIKLLNILKDFEYVSLMDYGTKLQLNFNKEFLRAFHLEIRDKAKETALKITEIKEAEYSLHYRFQDAKDFSIVTFYFNKEKMFSKVLIGLNSSKSFADYCLRQIGIRGN